MGDFGFFTREEASEAFKPRSRSKQGISDESLRHLGPAAVRNMNPAAKHPEMPPDGNSSPLVYVLGEAPGREDDEHGAPFLGPAGSLLKNTIPSWGRKKSLFDNCVRTRPPDNRKPRREEIECFRGVVTKSIAKAKPKVVMGVGEVALHWMLGVNRIVYFAGRKYPVSIGGHRCWFVPVLHPSFILRIEEGRHEKVPGKEWRRLWEKTIEDVYELAEKDLEPEILAADELAENVHLLVDLEKINEGFKRLEKCEFVGLDYETQNLRPYWKTSRVLTCALSDGDGFTMAFPIDHPESPWDKEERDWLVKRLGKFLWNGPAKIAHNVPFEMEWTIALCGEDRINREARWDCTKSAAYALDPGPPGDGAAAHSLNDLCLEHFGLALKAESEGTVNAIAKLQDQPLKEVLRYNALDAKVVVPLYRKLMAKIEREGLEESYGRQIDRVIPTVMAQRIGVPVDNRETLKFKAEFTREMNAVTSTIRELPEVEKYERHHKLNLGSPAHVQDFLVKQLGLKDITTTSAKVLEKYVKKHQFISELLKLRSLEKLMGTYVMKFLPDELDTYVYPDGRIHCLFNITKTRTTRLSSEGPNNQNWPKRKRKEVRKQLGNVDGMVLISVDQGQIEGRTIQMEARDRKWGEVLQGDYDIHREWAEKLARICPKRAKLLKEAPKVARHEAKNGMVFPAFYGSSEKSIIFNLDLPEEEGHELFEEFWEDFSGIKQWQRESWESYLRNGYVQSLTGRRRYGPLSFNMVVNTPPQADASDICVDAQFRLCWTAIETERPWLIPVLQIHDDLTFLVPKKHLDESLEVIVRHCLDFKAPWVNVPLVVEAEVGPNLGEMKPIGKWKTGDV